MIKLFKQSRCAAAVIITLSLSGCIRFDTRMQANGSFEYDQAKSIEKYQTGSLTNDEARNQFDIPELSEKQKEVGNLVKNVDIRPPVQLIPVIEGVMLEANDQYQTKVWFNAFNQDEYMSIKVWDMLQSYLAANNVEIVSQDETKQELQTGNIRQETVYGSALNKNRVIKNSSYRFNIEKTTDSHSVALYVDALTYSEVNDGKKLKIKLIDKNKQNIEIRFVNDLLEYAYEVKESEQLKDADSQPLPIKLGFDDNHQTAWVVDADFLQTWHKLPELFTLLSFKKVDADRNLGYYLVKFSQPDDEYWTENNLNSFELDEEEYFIQLGELADGSTSLTWLDADKKSLSNQQVSDIYLSITDKVRHVLLLNDKQTKEF
ncbi:outer membrane protein assembly factor BamC [Psychromonas aquimarina]|uniref:outer membrane protein assembly factor BamC n=1 Tax=Psychromonas aquimarina TaxID=444919 RepID=UPI00040F25B3|nr:outer membrane protein assembly factor BamC [Psychromonas aquimarina]